MYVLVLGTTTKIEAEQLGIEASPYPDSSNVSTITDILQFNLSEYDCPGVAGGPWPPPLNCIFNQNLSQSEIPMSNVSQSPVPSTVLSASCTDAQGTSMNKELTIHEEVISHAEFEKEIFSLTTQEEKEEANLGHEDIISAEFAQYAISMVSDPSIERTRQATKKSDAIPKERQEMPSFSASREQRFSERLSSKVPTTPKVHIDKIRLAAFGDSVEDIVLFKDEYQEGYGKFFKISIYYFIWDNIF